MGMLWPTLEFILGLSLAITLLVGGHEVLSGRITVGQFVAFNTYMMMLTWPVIALGVGGEPGAARHGFGDPHSMS